MTCTRLLRTWVLAVMGLTLLPSVAFAQDNAEYKKLYDDALAQLKQAQDRKTELNRENEQLKAKLADVQAQAEALRRDAADHAERTFFLRSHYAAWKKFIAQNPALMEQWNQYLGASASDLPAPDADPLVPLEPAVKVEPEKAPEKPAEQPPAEKPAETPPAEKPAEQPPAEKPAEQPPAEKPAEQPPAEKPAETPPAEKPAEQPPAEKPAEPKAEPATTQPATPPAEKAPEPPADQPPTPPATQPATTTPATAPSTLQASA